MNIVVTGASNGIGYYTCQRLAGLGEHTIFALSRDMKKLRKLKEEVAAGGSGSEVIPFRIDLSKKDAAEKFAKQLENQCRQIDILINNAGNLVNRPFIQLSHQDWESIYSVNVYGPVRLIKSLLPFLSARKKGTSHIVNISSMGGIQGSQKFKGLSAYSSSKAALICITECLAEELKESNIRVNCLALGSVETEMFKKAFPKTEAALTPELMANYIADFALNGSNYFNGKVLQVSAGTP